MKSEETKKNRKVNGGKQQTVAPDGGWGWIVILGIVITNVSYLPVIQNYGLIFNNRFERLGITATETAFIFNFNNAITSCIGLINGPILKRLAFRKYALLGAVVSATGVTLISQASSFFSYAMTFGVFMGAGFGMLRGSSNLALNSYFKNKRAIATGVLLSGMSIGSILMPLLITVMLESYGVSGTVFILGGISFNAIAGSLLLQPVEWHLRPLRTTSVSQGNEEAPFLSEQTDQNENKHQNNVNSGVKEQNITNLEILNSKDVNKNIDDNVKDCVTQKIDVTTSDCDIDVDGISRHSGKKKRNFLASVVSFFDLDLLRQPAFVSILTGLVAMNFAELNFNMVIQFALYEIGFSKEDVATSMAVMAGTDVTSRLLIPLLAQRFHWKPRILCVIGIFGLNLGRTILQYVRSYSLIISLSAFLGFFKGMRLLFQTLIIPNYCTLDKLPAANGIFMFTSGILSISVGPLLGSIRDAGGSYFAVIHTISILSGLTVVIWTVEFLLTRRNKGKT